MITEFKPDELPRKLYASIVMNLYHAYTVPEEVRIDRIRRELASKLADDILRSDGFFSSLLDISVLKIKAEAIVLTVDEYEHLMKKHYLDGCRDGGWGRDK